ncbi:hypothetical protein DdX_21699 [Ditylenchus destructor]|uniref:Uncharacterized protein n=1 Tax=Ditylenchus destructor TaxID=166010 RepID=A0AAD4MFF1_9BILA|nr:hypothetical protein DdX_21699 [Ditylenchus destructor]
MPRKGWSPRQLIRADAAGLEPNAVMPTTIDQLHVSPNTPNHACSDTDCHAPADRNTSDQARKKTSMRPMRGPM